MPIYEYQCIGCNEVTEKLLSVSECSIHIICPKCDHGVPAKRIISGGSRKHAESRSIWSKAFGIHPDQITEMRQRFPDDEYHPVTGAMKINGFEHQKKVAKRLGMVID